MGVIRRTRQANSQRKHSSGFTLMEVLVAVLVLSIGLLGLAGLQLTSLRNNTSAYHRSQATAFAYDILDRMRANREAARSGKYDLAITATPSSGTTTEAKDLQEWRSLIGGALPGGTGSVDVDDNEVTIVVQWHDERVDTTADDYEPFQFQVQSRL